MATTEYGQLAFETEKSPRTHGRVSYPRVVSAAKSSPLVNLTCKLCRSNHNLSDCESFIAKPVNERWKTAKEFGYCFRCLQSGHRSKDCSEDWVCGEEGCNRPHHRLLHSHYAVVSNVADGSGLVCSVSNGISNNVQLGYVPVELMGPNGNITTYAFLDNGSDCTLINESLSEKLGISKNLCELKVTTLHGTRSLRCGRGSLSIRSIDGSFNASIDQAIIVRHLPVTHTTNYGIHAQKHSHLKDLKFTKLSEDTVGILIGCDVPEAHLVLDQRIGNGKQPFATKSPLGWILRGPIGSHASNNLSVNSIQGYQSARELIIKLYENDFMDFGDPDEPQSSMDDDNALQIVERSAKLKDGHYELAVPWRVSNDRLLNNIIMAEKRLGHLKRRFLRDTSLQSRYQDQMNNHLSKGHFALGTTPNERWFLPHHPVLNSNKPDKVRVVFDCAAKYRETSLNDMLLKGPDWTNALVGVLIRFRHNAIALSADIREMFLQVRLAPEDREKFSFLWWQDGDMERDPKVYEWCVHPFGAISSPFCANYALRRTIKDNEHLFSKETISAAKAGFYVDDFLYSVETLDDARKIVSEVRALMNLGGFELVKWVSNHPTSLDNVPSSDRSCSDSNVRDRDHCQRTLGLRWNMAEDVFTFDVKGFELPLTRRRMLSYIASIYDPLGMLAPFVLPGKLLLQALCRDNLGWDSPISQELGKRWNVWVNRLQFLKSLRIPRCIRPSHSVSCRPELHVFSDASESGYGMVAYIRYESNEEVNTTFLFGKAHVRPLKPVTIPRLELVAALLAARITVQLERESALQYTKIILWTDSAIVLRYLSNTTSRFSTFVANRVRRIRDLTELYQWRHVPSVDNSADLASRGVRGSYSKAAYEWLRGPTFLLTMESEWPSPLNHTDHALDNELEIKEIKIVALLGTEYDWLEHIADRKGTWIDLVRAIVWLSRFKIYWLMTHGGKKNVSINVGRVSLDEYRRAEFDIIRIVQRQHFEIKTDVDANGNEWHRVPTLAKLKPGVRAGLIVVGGRIRGPDYNLLVIPQSGRIVELIIRYFHESSAHAGPVHVLAALRRRFWLIKGMTTVKNVIRRCAKCRIAFAKPCAQAMAPLPDCRVRGGDYPFQYCGVDYFGPFHVSVGRKTFKRYGCLFTCMQTRAIHIEVSHDLSTDSFIMALNRFISRRGPPSVFYSDNGSNFVGTVSELRRLHLLLDHARIDRAIQIHGIEWKFNPPHASHRGGIWERLIRSVRRVLGVIMCDQVTTDEVLLTSLAEAERIVNDRPLIPVYDDPENPTVLRPNDLLLLRSNIGLCDDRLPLSVKYTRRWRQSQHLVNSFWKRWKSEYLNTLRSTRKWLKVERNIKKGDLVLLIDKEMSKGSWPQGIVSEAIPGPDGLVRQALIRTSNGTLKRDVRSLCLLEGAM